MYHGKGRHVSLEQLERYDVVLTTYTLLALEAPLHVGGRRAGTQNKPIDLCSDSSPSEDDVRFVDAAGDTGASPREGLGGSPSDAAAERVGPGVRTLVGLPWL